MTYLLLSVELILVLVLAPWFGLLGAIVSAAIVRRLRHSSFLPRVDRPSSLFLVLIPAHDEANVIAVTVASCRALDYPADQFQVVVIADNCTDDTAQQAENSGALVVVRADPERKSKGFALDDFFRGAIGHPQLRRPDAFVLIDADTSVAPDLLRAFDQSLHQGADFVQGYYTVRNADASWRTRMMTYAFSLANGVWLAGSNALGLSVGLKGNGMCFRAAALDRFPWRVHGLVEDMEYAWALHVGGARVEFQPLAIVYGEMVSRGGSGAASQRRRWEAGRQTLRSSVRPVLWRSSHLSVAQKLAAQVQLSFPPLSRLLVGLLIASGLAGWRLWFPAGRPGWRLLDGMLVADWIIFVVYALSPMLVLRLPGRYLISLVHLPYYMLWKILIGRRQQPDQWVRTPREVTTADSAGRFKN